MRKIKKTLQISTCKVMTTEGEKVVIVDTKAEDIKLRQKISDVVGHNNFMVTEVVETEKTYVMDGETFLKYATEENATETIDETQAEKVEVQ